MNKGHLEFLGALALTASVAATGCSNDDGNNDPSGQTTGTSSPTGSNAPGPNAAGSSGGGAGNGTPSAPASNAGAGNTTPIPGPGNTPSAPLNCTAGTPCGGDVVGTWKVTSSCLKLEGDLDVSLLSLSCPTVPATGQLETTGSITFNEDGTYSDDTTTTGSLSFPLDAECLTVSNVPVSCDRIASIFEPIGWTSGTCSEQAGQCSCELSANQQGGAGQTLSYTEPTGTYTTMDSALKASNAEYEYCSADNTLTLIPQLQALTGTVELQKEGGNGDPVGAGGMSGEGGMAAASGGGGMGPMAGEGGMGGMGVEETGGAGGAGEPPPPGDVVAPCDIYDAAGTPCVAAHSTVRALFGSFDGALYQVKRADGTTQDIPVLSAGGFADSAAQDTFCAGSSCTMWRVYDQTGNGNFLEAQTTESEVAPSMNANMNAANAAAEKITVGGHEVYSLFTRPSQAYWNDGSDSGMPLGDEPQGIYVVTSGTHFNTGCCYNYGNGQLDRMYNGGPQMDALYFGNSKQWGTGAGDGPWVMADMEDGMLAGGSGGQNPDNMPLPFPFVTAVEKNNGTDTFALRGGDATQGTLTTMWDGALPNSKRPMRKEGAVLMGAGGDCCYSNNNASEGTFYEGAIVAGYPSDDTDQAVHQNVIEVGYGQ